MTGLLFRVRARIVKAEPGRVTIRPVEQDCPLLKQLTNQTEPVDTMVKLFRYSVKQHGERPALGTRAVLGEVQEKQTK